MGGSSKPQTVTQVNKNEPLPEQRGYLADIWADAAKLRESGSPQYYPGSTVVDWSQPTKDAWAQQEAFARDPNNSAVLNAANSALIGVLNGQAPGTATNTWNSIQGAKEVASNPFLSGFSAMAGGSRDYKDLGFFKDGQKWVNEGVGATKDAMAKMGQGSGIDKLAGGGDFTNAALAGQTAQANALNGRTNEGTQYLRDTASGKYLDAGNPYLTDYISQVLSPMQDQFKTATARDASAFAAAGRLGGGAYADRVNSTNKNYSDSLAKTATDLAFNNYNMERDRQMAAQNAIGSFDRSDVEAARGAWNDLSGTSSNQQGLRNSALSAAEGLRQGLDGLRLQGAGQLGAQSVAQQQIRTGAAESIRNQYNADTGTRLNAGQAGAQTFDNDTKNKLQQQQIKLAAANAQASDDVARGNQKIAASTAAGTVYDNMFKPIDKLKEVGSAQEQQSGAYLQDAMNRWNAEQNKDWENLYRELGVHQGLGYGQGTSTSTQPVYSNKGAGVLGAGASVLGALAKCDRRLKTDIARIGATHSGLPLYAFRYVDTGEWAFGPMADEVEAVAPDAVAILPDHEHMGVHVPNMIAFETREAR